MRVAVTGVGGFVGAHLAAELHRAGHTVVGLGLAPDCRVAGISDYIATDLAVGWPPAGRFDAVVHLAARAAVGPSFADPQGYYQANSAPLTHLCEALLASASERTRVLNVSTGAVYAAGTERHERSPITHSSPYVVSKLLAEMQASYYRRRGLDVVTVRPFNHIGPGQSPGFLLPDLVASIETARFSGEPMLVGDLDTRRDYTDVRDVVRAYRLLLEVERLDHALFNVCSGSTLSGREILKRALEAMPGPRPEVVLDTSRTRPDDPREISGDPTRLYRATGWLPQVNIGDTVRDFVAAR